MGGAIALVTLADTAMIYRVIRRDLLVQKTAARFHVFSFDDTRSQYALWDSAIGGVNWEKETQLRYAQNYFVTYLLRKLWGTDNFCQCRCEISVRRHWSWCFEFGRKGRVLLLPRSELWRNWAPRIARRVVWRHWLDLCILRRFPDRNNRHWCL